MITNRWIAEQWVETPLHGCHTSFNQYEHGAKTVRIDHSSKGIIN